MFPEGEETTEVKPEPFLKEVFADEGQEADEAFVGGVHNEKMLEMILGAGGGFKVQPTMEDVVRNLLSLRRQRMSALPLGQVILSPLQDLPGRCVTILERS